MAALSYLQARVQKRWEPLGPHPIGLHGARHTAATWLDQAGTPLRAHAAGKLERARAGSVPRESGPDRRCHEIWLRRCPSPGLGRNNVLGISLRFRSLRRSPERLGSLYAGDFGLSGAGSKTVVGGFVHRGFESHPLRSTAAIPRHDWDCGLRSPSALDVSGRHGASVMRPSRTHGRTHAVPPLVRLGWALTSGHRNRRCSWRRRGNPP
jgi:hypothetical protein